MSRPGYKTKSDTMLLRRLINNLKERGSEVAGELERKAHNFLTDVQIKRKKKPEETFDSDDDSGSDWEDIPDPPIVRLVIPPPLLLPVLEPLKTPTPPPSPPTPEIISLPTPPPQPIIEQPFIPVVEVASPPREPTPEPEKPLPKPKSPLPNRQQIRTLTKDTPSMSADKPKLTPDCKLYWIQKHLEQEKEEEEERARKRKMSIVSLCSGNSELSNEDEENRLREEEARRIDEERKLREEAERLRALQEKRKEEERLRAEQELIRKQEETRRKLEEETKRKSAQEETRRKAAEEEARRKIVEEENKKRVLEEEKRKKLAEEEAKRKAEEEAKRKEAEEREKIRAEEELAQKLKEQLILEEAERARLEEEARKKQAEEELAAKELKKKVKVSGQRSKKPTMAREWRKLKEKQKHDAPKELAVEQMEVDVTPEISPLPPRAKYVPPVFKENECYADRHNTFLIGAWPHNNKKGIPTPSELAEAGFFFIGPGDYCRCYQCGLEQMCWEPFESPWVRHGFLAPDCCYVERIKGRDWVEAVLKGEF